MESKLANNILASEKVMGALAKEYADGARSMVPGRRGDFAKKSDKEIKNDLIYFLEQHCGVCLSPSTISKALDDIWDKIQLGAREYGYKGPITPQKSNEPSPRIVEKAERVLADESLMRALGSACYYGSRQTHMVRGFMMAKDYWGSYPNIIITYGRDAVGYVSFGEAKEIARYIMKDIKKAAKEYAAEREEEKKESEASALSEAVYKDVMKKLKRLNG